MCRRCRLEKCLSVGKYMSKIKVHSLPYFIGMKRISPADEEERLNKLRQLEENRRVTKNATHTSTQPSFTDVSIDENEQLMDEPVTLSESQRVSRFHDNLSRESSSICHLRCPP